MIKCSRTSMGNMTSRCRRGRRGCMIGVDVLIGRLANRPYKSTIPSNGLVGAATKTVATNSRSRPYKLYVMQC